EDAVEPGLEVGALLEPPEPAVGLEVRLLDEILGVGRVAGHTHGRGVQRVHERSRLFGKRRLIGHRRSTYSPGVATPKAGRWPRCESSSRTSRPCVNAPGRRSRKAR